MLLKQFSFYYNHEFAKSNKKFAISEFFCNLL